MASCLVKYYGDKEKFKSLGLITSHAYSVLNVAEVEKEGTTHQIIEVRNPWGSFEWKGDWSDSSDIWTDELREKLGCVEKNDGRFWMPYEEFPKHFGRVQIIKYYDDYQLTNISHKGDWGAHLVQVPEDGNYNFSISQVGDRMFPRKTDYWCSYSRMFLMRIPEGVETMRKSKKTHYIGGSTQTGNQERECHLETNIEAGQYILFT